MDTPTNKPHTNKCVPTHFTAHMCYQSRGAGSGWAIDTNSCFMVPSLIGQHTLQSLVGVYYREVRTLLHDMYVRICVTT